MANDRSLLAYPQTNGEGSASIDHLLERKLWNVSRSISWNPQSGPAKDADESGVLDAKTLGRMNDAGDFVYVPALNLELLGDRGFRANCGLKYAYIAGAMANGIGS